MRATSPANLLALVLLVAVVAWTLAGVVRNRPHPRFPQPPAGAGEAAGEGVWAPDEPPLPPPTATVTVDARPWGKLVAVETEAGERWALPEVTTTPLRLELPLGAWRLELLHPEHPSERRGCELLLTAGTDAACAVEFARLSVDAYFREHGWWR